jgi:hypothetical protein
MQSPLETSVKALRNTRPVEEICAYTEANPLSANNSYAWLDSNVAPTPRALVYCFRVVRQAGAQRCVNGLMVMRGNYVRALIVSVLAHLQPHEISRRHIALVIDR